MPSTIHVHFLPDHFKPTDVQGGTVVVVDILRASTTILTALQNGAVCVVPCRTAEEARERRTQQPDILLGGERGGLKIAGFDLGNSPREYSTKAVHGRTVAFTTTNGTRALLMSQQADEILIGAFSNLSSLANRLAGNPRPLHIVCAGTDGAVTGEDVLFAGRLTEVLTSLSSGGSALTDSTQIALGFWRSATSETSVENALRSCLGGHNLVSLGYDADIAFAAGTDTCSIIARFEMNSRSIRPQPPDESR